MNRSLFSRLFLPLTILLFWGCTSQKPVTPPSPSPAPELAEDIEMRLLDTLVVAAPRDGEPRQPESYQLPVYNPSHTRTNDLLHTRLDLRFDWDEEAVIGKATLRLKPYFYPTARVTLDAKNFDFHLVALGENRQPLTYTYEKDQLVVQLDRTYQREESYTLYIEYTAHPSESGGSAAITSDRGLFFIKPDENDPGKPYQIWTQGETESNSRWFPTIDKPNERCTQEMYLTVDERFKTLSNGLLISSRKNDDGTRTDYWKMDQPHAPYLFMIAVGEYAIVRDTWNGIPVEYYVEPDFEQDARAIFPHTPEMLQFFSDKLQVAYPWPKYNQVVVRDYVSGAMENTTAVIFGEFMQRRRRELIDELSNEKIVAHELFHHWFGDLVTCESWANLPLNEGFANYSEYLWLEHKYGADEADFHLINEWNGYIGQSAGEVYPLIRFGYDDRESMFDAHSYNKGGAVLHMLRRYLGDEAFFAALNRYLTQHAYSAVEVHDLRLAMEAVAGEDLNWFFNQWYLNAGHPSLEITYGYDESAGQATVTIEQNQDTDGVPAIFQIPAAIDIYLAEGQAPVRHRVRVSERKQTFAFDVPHAPLLINFDAERALLAESRDNKTEEQLVFQYDNGPKFLDRFEALQQLQNKDAGAQVMRDALRDPFWYIRGTAVTNIDSGSEIDETTRATVRQIAASDPHSQVRAAALSILAEIEDPALLDLAKAAIEKDSSYDVITAGFELLTQLDRDVALTYARKLENETSDALINAVGALYAEAGDTGYLPFFEKNLTRLDGYPALDFFSNYLALAAKKGPESTTAAVERFTSIATNMGQSPWRRVAVMNALNQLRGELLGQAEENENADEKTALESRARQLTLVMENIAATETNSQIKSLYDQILDR